MRKLFGITALLFLFSCQQGKVDYEKEIGATAKFHHRDHKKFIDKNGCIPCHEMNVSMSWADIEAAERGSKKIIMPSKVTCHYCHNNPGKTPAAEAPTRCYLCHLNMEALKPEDHKTGNWLKVHKVSYEANPDSCRECHRKHDCIDCHIRRDTIQHLVHPRNYTYTHSLEAAADPSKCSRCHQIGFCFECHTKGSWTR